MRVREGNARLDAESKTEERGANEMVECENAGDTACVVSRPFRFFSPFFLFFTFLPSLFFSVLFSFLLFFSLWLFSSVFVTHLCVFYSWILGASFEG